MREYMDVSEVLFIKSHQSLSHRLFWDFWTIRRSALMPKPFEFVGLKMKVSLKIFYSSLQGDYNG